MKSWDVAEEVCFRVELEKNEYNYQDYSVPIDQMRWI